MLGSLKVPVALPPSWLDRDDADEHDAGEDRADRQQPSGGEATTRPAPDVRARRSSRAASERSRRSAARRSASRRAGLRAACRSGWPPGATVRERGESMGGRAIAPRAVRPVGGCIRPALVDTVSHMTTDAHDRPAQPRPRAGRAARPRARGRVAERRHRGLRRADRARARVGRGRARQPARGRRAQRRRQEHAAQADGRAARSRGRAGSRSSARRPGREARRVAYVPQAEMVDWAFPVTVEDVVMMGRFPRLGPIRRPGRDDRRAVVDALDAGRHGAPPADADRAPVRRPAAAGVPRPGAGRGAGPVPARRAGHRHRRDHAGAPDGPPRGAGAARQDGRRHHPRPRLRGAAVPAGAGGQPDGRRLRARRTSSSTPTSSPRAYGGHLLVLEGRTVILDDAHHHDDAAPGERHFHERDGSR